MKGLHQIKITITIHTFVSQEPDMATFQSVFNVPWIGRKYLQCKIKKSLAAQGFLAHTDKEVNGIAERDLKAISRVLG